MELNKHVYAVIMAGGGGTRLWPVSRKENPKQLLDIFNGRSLFEIAVRRLKGLIPFERILVVTVAEQAKKLQKLVTEIPSANYLIEPLPRGTAAVVALAAAALQKMDPSAVMVVLTADHFINNVEIFHSAIKAGCQLADEGNLVTLGIEPTFPSSGYGYIELGNPIGDFNKITAYKAIRFEEKPDENRAIDFIKSGKFLWNSGMFIWKTATVLTEITELMPDITQVIGELQPWIGIDHGHGKFIEAWTSIKPQTVDYGIMEKSRRVGVIPVKEIGWNDVGSWDSLFDVLPADENGNILLGDQIHMLDSKDTLVFSDEKEKLIIPLGIKNMIIVNTSDALMICPRGDSQKVKQLVDYLRTNHYTLFL